MARSVRFYAEKRKDKSGKLIEKNVPILFSFSFDGERIKSTTGEKAEHRDHWSETTQRFKASTTNASLRNKKLKQLSEKLETIYLDIELSGMKPTAQMIKQKLNDEQKKEKETFFDIYDRFVSEQKIKNSWTDGTTKRFKVVRNKLESFQSIKGKGYEIDFSLMNETFFDEYLSYLLKQNYKNSYIKKNLKLLFWFLNWCKRKGYNLPYDYTQFRFKGNEPRPGANIRPLTMEQLMTMYSKPITNIRLSQVRDVFCFSCFTGLRYSDLKNLKKADIGENREYLTITTVKTAEPLYIPLVKYAREILARYENTFSKYALPVISQQRYNNYLKELGKIMKFNDELVHVNYSGNQRIENTFQKWERLTSHVGRQTFITNAIFLGMPGEVVKDLTGQSSDEMLKNYFKILDQQKRSEMQKFEQYETKISSA
ncbi:MAG TPA: site-specific integrase [Bacteroidales bacterium]|nr:site-specific integrase [Bacteroidales bacterium]HQH15037.1 site-specific integrase [Bacteroidales bacterium]HQP54177.1 site-specific integrase [Bacteroidales bacterium]